MPTIVQCPECRIEVELPPVIRPEKKYACPDCATRLPTSPSEEPRPKKRPKPKPKKRKRKEPEEKPFWKTKTGKILSGLGFLVLGVGVLAYAIVGDPNKPIKLIIGAICAIFVGLGSLGYGFMATDDSDDDSDDDDDCDSGGGDWSDD